MKRIESSDADSKKQKIQILESIAQQIKHNISVRKRPLFVEFSGLPKAGKTTSVNSLAMFLRRNDISVKVITERAAVCPIGQKDHPFFNVWTSCTSLINTLELAVKNEHSVVILDRGIFDSLIWMALHRNQGKLTESDFCVIESFLLLARWQSLIDVVIFMTTTTETAIKREFKDLLTEKEGAIMNERVLNQWLTAAQQVKGTTESKFRRFIEIDTTNKETIDGVEEITKAVLTALKELSDEELMVMPRDQVSQEIDANGFVSDKNSLKTLTSALVKSGHKQRRADAEDDASQVQLIVGAVFEHDGSIMVFRKRKSNSSTDRMLTRDTVWVGGHLRWEDWTTGGRNALEAAARRCLTRELEEELGLTDGRLRMEFLGFAYDKSNHRSHQHLAILFKVKTPSTVIESLNRSTFRESTGQELRAELVKLDTAHLEQRAPNLEAWSVDVLRSAFGVNVALKPEERQLKLF